MNENAVYLKVLLGSEIISSSLTVILFCQNFENSLHHVFLNVIFNVCLEPGSESPMEDSPSTDRLRFDRFDICRLLKHGASLLGSAGAEFEVQDDKSGISLYCTCKLENVGLNRLVVAVF